MRLRPAVTLFECACVVDWLFYNLSYVLCVLYAFVYACWQAPCRAGTACWHMSPTGIPPDRPTPVGPLSLEGICATDNSKMYYA